MKQFWVVFCLLISNYSAAQLFIHFEDSTLENWNQHPSNRWVISDQEPINGNLSLKHEYDNNTSSRDRIAFPLVKDFSSHEIYWRFQVKYDYNPSGSNNWGFFLMSDAGSEEMHPSGSASGYLVGVNYSGSDDVFKLWRVASGSGYELVNTGFDWQQEIAPGTSVGIEVRRSPGGEWEIKLDPDGGFDELQIIGQGTNSDYQQCSHIGIYYEYTSSADSRLWIDDVSASYTLIDDTAPTLTRDSLASARELILQFSESMDTTALYSTENYRLNETIQPLEVEILDSTHTNLLLSFEEPFADSAHSTLHLSGLKDAQENSLADTAISFFYQRLRTESLQIISDSSLAVGFSGRAKKESLLELTNYLLDHEPEHPTSVVIKDTTPARVVLRFSRPFQSGVKYQLNIENILDHRGDPMLPYEQSFRFIETTRNDVVITEIMADPNPSAGLPEYEYLEILNMTQYELDLTGWELQIGGSRREIDSLKVAPGEYVIICETEASGDLSGFGKVYSMASLPALKNSGTQLRLTDSLGYMIHELEYTDEWYGDPEKEEGGYSLEKIDPSNHCSGASNWKASQNSSGGTPGSINSVYAENMDLQAPRLIHFTTHSVNQVAVELSEPLHHALRDSVELFSIEPALGNPFSILSDEEMPTFVQLLFSKDFVQNGRYTFRAAGIYDRCLNDTSFQHEFTYHETEPYDVLINEVMTDPEPSIELPEAEYIELYNRSGYDIQLEGWKLHIGSSVRSLSSYRLDDQEYLIICDTSHLDEYHTFGNVLGINLPSISNNGELIFLENKRNRVVDAVDIQTQWHENEYKQEGGWSLELIDPFNPCGEKENWNSSVSEWGGSPGAENSIYSSNPDELSPYIRYVSYLDSNEMAVRFNESLDRFHASKNDNYTLANLGHPVRTQIIPPDFKEVHLLFEDSFQPATRYTLTVQNNIKDCAGNTVKTNETVDFEVPGDVQYQDLVINEILFNPLPDGADYVELYNRAEKTLDLSALCLSNGGEKLDCMNEHPILIFPGEYLVLTENKESVCRDYHCSNPSKIHEVEDLPDYSNDAGIVRLYNRSQLIIDEFPYTEEMHFPLLNTTEGVALERIHPDKPTNDQDSWHSASDASGYGTPGYQNSQYTDSKDVDKRFHVEPEVFSPNNDGHNDLLSINYQFDKAGIVATLEIYDAKGRRIRTLVNNKTLSTEGSVNWDGLTDDNQNAPMGIYLIYIELFDLEGNTEAIKKHCVLGR